MSAALPFDADLYARSMEYARSVGRDVNFHLGKLDDEEFRATFDVLLHQLAIAYAEGWNARVRRRK